MSAYFFFVLIVFLAAGVSDCRTGKIPNLLLGTAWITGFFLFPSYLYFPLGILTAAVLYPLFRMRMTGAGDVKLYAVLCSLLGPMAFPEAAALSVILGAVWGVARALQSGSLKPGLMRILAYVKIRLSGVRIPYRRDAQRHNEDIPMGAAVFFALLICGVIWQGQVPGKELTNLF